MVKSVLITGASIGIGRTTALLFAEKGWNVILTYYKDKKEGEEAAKRCREYGVKVELLRLNVMDSKSISDIFESVKERFKEIDFLINNAGIISWEPLIRQSEKDIEDQVRVNLEGLIKITKKFLPVVKEGIINISSGAGKVGYDDLSVYCATKFGVRGFTQSLREDNDVNARLTVVSVNPGMTKTRMTDFKGIEPEKVADVIYRTVVGKIKPDNLGDVDVEDYII